MNILDEINSRLANIEKELTLLRSTEKTPESKSSSLDLNGAIEYLSQLMGRNIPVSFIYQKTYSGCKTPIPYRKIGRSLVFDKKELQSWFQNNSISNDKPINNLKIRKR